MYECPKGNWIIADLGRSFLIWLADWPFPEASKRCGTQQVNSIFQEDDRKLCATSIFMIEITFNHCQLLVTPNLLTWRNVLVARMTIPCQVSRANMLQFHCRPILVDVEGYHSDEEHYGVPMKQDMMPVSDPRIFLKRAKKHLNSITYTTSDIPYGERALLKELLLDSDKLKHQAIGYALDKTYSDENLRESALEFRDQCAVTQLRKATISTTAVVYLANIW